ncbi:MAG: hypothetical protein NTW38_01625 [Candidatus Aminicenantes bacterium]|nr:hypothetical protein [Candidatus Aminicenantes bacterium]
MENSLEKIREALLNAFLCLSPETAHLRDIAYAKVILWVLFIEYDRSLQIDEIAKKGAELIQVASLPVESFETAIEILQGRRMVVKKEELWSLVPKEKENLEKTLKHSEEVTEDILNRHFSKKIDREALRHWFNEANKVYFGAQSQNLLSLYNDGNMPMLRVDEVIRPLIKHFKMNQFEGDLLQGYKEFLTSDNSDDIDRVFRFMGSLLSAKIVSAEISPEVLALDRYKNADFIIDTNVLFAMTAYKNETTENALKALGRSAKALGINIYIADFTTEEYETVRMRERAVSINLWKSFSFETLKGMDRKDIFSQGLLRTGCRTTQDVERFFDEGLKTPSKLGEVDIEMLTGINVEGTEFNASADSVLFNKIQGIYEEFAGRKKSEGPARHDTRLWKLAQSRDKHRNAFVLTVDQTMTALALKEAGPKDDPLWQNLFGLVQILALNGGGATYDPSDLAPLFRIFADFDDLTNKEKYDKRDLILLSEKTERVRELPETKIKATLLIIHRARLSNNAAMMHDAVVEIERTLRQDDIAKDQTIREHESTISDLGSQLTNERAEKKISKKKVVWLCFTIKSAVALLVDYILFFYLWDNFVSAFATKNNFEVVQIIAQIIAPLSYIFASLLKAVKSVRQINKD